MADRTLATVRKLFNWHAARDESFVSPVVSGMSRTNGKERARDRVLSDDEIRCLWPLLDDFGTFGSIVKVLFLTAQRRTEVAEMSRSAIDDQGIWIIPAKQYKTKRLHAVPLSNPVHEIVRSQPLINGSDLIFTHSGATAFSGFSKAKRRHLGEFKQAWAEASSHHFQMR